MPNLTAQILRNLGMPIRLAEVVQSVESDTKLVAPSPGAMPVETTTYKTSWVKALDENGEMQTLRTHLRLDNNALALIEIYYGSMKGFNDALQSRSSGTMRVAFTAALGFDPNDEDDLKRVGAMLIDEDSAANSGALQVALAVANGVDPSQAVGLAEETKLTIKEMKAEAETEMAKHLEDAAEERRQMKALTEPQQEILRQIAKDLEAADPEAPTPQEKQLLDLIDLRPIDRLALAGWEASTPTEPETTPGKSGSGSGSESDEPTLSSGQ